MNEVLELVSISHTNLLWDRVKQLELHDKLLHSSQKVQLELEHSACMHWVVSCVKALEVFWLEESVDLRLALALDLLKIHFLIFLAWHSGVVNDDLAYLGQLKFCFMPIRVDCTSLFFLDLCDERLETRISFHVLFIIIADSKPLLL